MALTPPPTAPSTTDPATFASRADALVAWHATNVAELAALQTDVTASSATAIAAANFKGTWASRTGAANVPYCVAHLSKYWMLQSNIADITVKVPGTASEWQEILGAATFAGIVAQGGNLTGAINEARGTVAMHATTMDIWTGKPAILDGTGSPVTITAIANAPQAGARRTLYPIAGTVITNGATFAVDGAANYTTVSGDALEFEAVTTSTYKVHIIKADGTAVIAPAATSGQLLGAFRNLQLSATGLSANVTVTVDEIVVEDSSNVYKTLRTVSLTIAGTTTGANALDTGTIATSTWYSVWVIYNGTTTAGLLSTSATAPTMPSGYTYKARIGWIRTDGTANKYPLSFTQAGRSVNYKVASGSNVTAYPTMASGNQGSVTTPTWVAVGVSSFVPSTAIAISVTAAGNGSTNNDVLIAPNNSFGNKSTTTNPAPFVVERGSAGPAGQVTSFLLESTNIYVAQTFSISGQSQCVGWEDNI